MALSSLLTILGCGTSTGVPILTCKCKICRSRNPRNKRTRSSAWWQIPIAPGRGRRGKSKTLSLVLDTGPDFRQQALRERIDRVDAVLYSHPHADHLNGCDELRAFNYTQKAPIPIYGNEWLVTEFRERFPYVFDGRTPEGGILPTLTPSVIGGQGGPFEINGVSILPISLSHGSRETLGYRIDSVAYVSDCSYISPSSLERLKDLEVLILDCVRLKPHGTHLHLDKSLEIISQLRPKKAILTHLGHDFDYANESKLLPKGVRFAYDGMKIRS